MKKILLVAVFAIVLAGCETEYDITDAESSKFQTKCLNGVEYYILREEPPTGYQGYGYMAVKYNRNGTVETC